VAFVVLMMVMMPLWKWDLRMLPSDATRMERYVAAAW
jgi:hypothetical protein